MVEPIVDPDTPSLDVENITDEQREILQNVGDSSLVEHIENIYQLWWRWADFHLFIITPNIDVLNPPVIIQPELIPGTHEFEHVYPIHDHGYKLSTSKGEDMFVTGLSMCKLYYTIEKMIFILVERLKSRGVSTESEVEVAFDGHELAQRKCFDSIINLSYNVVVTNFDPGTWGERYLAATKRIADLGYGFPPESPRDIYRKPHGSVQKAKI